MTVDFELVSCDRIVVREDGIDRRLNGFQRGGSKDGQRMIVTNDQWIDVAIDVIPVLQHNIANRISALGL